MWLISNLICQESRVQAQEGSETPKDTPLKKQKNILKNRPKKSIRGSFMLPAGDCVLAWEDCKTFIWLDYIMFIVDEKCGTRQGHIKRKVMLFVL